MREVGSSRIEEVRSKKGGRLEVPVKGTKGSIDALGFPIPRGEMCVAVIGSCWCTWEI